VLNVGLHPILSPSRDGDATLRLRQPQRTPKDASPVAQPRAVHDVLVAGWTPASARTSAWATIPRITAGRDAGNPVCSRGGFHRVALRGERTTNPIPSPS
jgi:hypothetical protein